MLLLVHVFWMLLKSVLRENRKKNYQHKLYSKNKYNRSNTALLFQFTKPSQNF